MYFANLSLLSFDQFLQDFLLFSNNGTELRVHDLRVKLAAHQGCTFIVLDVALIYGLGQLDILAEALFLEVSDGKFVGKRQEVKDAVPNMIILNNTIRLNRIKTKIYFI